jgi:ketosteroid isomerase-like protein
MSQENVEIVKKSFEAHNAGGIDAALAFYDADLIWDAGPEWVEGRVYRGHEGARRLDAVFVGSFDDYRLTVHEIRAVGERVLALYEVTGRIKGSGLPIRQPIRIVLSDFDEGMIGRVQSFFSWKEALAAVGSAG